MATSEPDMVHLVSRLRASAEYHSETRELLEMAADVIQSRILDPWGYQSSLDRAKRRHPAAGG